MTATVSVALVDDHTLVRQGLCRMLESEGLAVVAQGASVAEGQALLATTPFDVLVVDVTLPDGSGIDLARAGRARSETLGIVVLTMHGDDDTLLQALDAGASAFLHKTAAFEEILDAVHRSHLHPDVFSASGLAGALRRQNHDAKPHLTARELDVLTCLGEGRSVAQVAQRLHLSESTVKTHVSRVYEKLGAANRTQAVMAAVRLGLLSVPD
ncbi:MAG TPA: response regulator transcription factor [Actinomycetales bacterium]|nr:response regulator transcription factor [Actinomycetales bacterium]